MHVDPLVLTLLRVAVVEMDDKNLAPFGSLPRTDCAPHFFKRIIDVRVTNFRRPRPGPLPVLRHLLRKLRFSRRRGEPKWRYISWIGATNCYAEGCGELRETTPRLLVVAPQLSAVVNIKITSRFGPGFGRPGPLVLRQ